MVENGEIQKPAMSIEEQRPLIFLGVGLLFLFGSFILFAASVYLLYVGGEAAKDVVDNATGDLSDVQIWSLVAAYLPPIVTIVTGIITSFVGIILLKAAGIGRNHVIPPDDFPILGPALKEGDDKVITEYIRLSSLSGITGTFTKVGLTGLPLATIVLTVFLALLGIFDTKFFDLAQLTLGAFIGSYVQKQSSQPDISALGTSPEPLPPPTSSATSAASASDRTRI